MNPIYASPPAPKPAPVAVPENKTTPTPQPDAEPFRKRPRHNSAAPAADAPGVTEPLPDADRSVTYNFVGNEFLLSRSRAWLKVFDPASQAFVTRVPESTREEVVLAVTSAADAQPGWAALPAQKRRAQMFQLLAVLRARKPLICHHICVEVGKTVLDAEAEFERGLDAIETACATTNELPGQHVVNSPAEVHTINEPLGVCLAITPFNFPFMIPLWSIPYALLAGNTMVLKPSERTPTAAQILAECCAASGLPPGVLAVVHGSARVVSHLLAQPAIRAVSFVGSDIAGEAVYEHAKATRKRVQAECSGKNHGVVLPDATKTSTLFAIAGSAFGAAGQRCMALSVAVLVGPDTAAWTADLVHISRRLVIGCGRDAGVDVGPLISREAKRRVEDIIAGAEAEGATVLLDGRGYKVDKYPDGNFIGPTILTDVKPYMTCYQEEIFGPVLVCVTVDTLEEAVQLINDNRYGNGCTIFTSSPRTAQKFQRAVNVGQIGVNVPILAPSGPVLRSGNKDSFLGEVNVHGRSYWQFFTQTKTITTLWNS